MASRGAMELSVGTLVVLILGIVILIGGSALVWKIVASSDEIATRLDGAHRQRLQQLLTSGQLVAVAPSSQTVDAKEDFTFGVAVRNTLGDEKTFKIAVVGTNATGTDVVLTLGWTVSLFDELTLGENEDATTLIGVRPPADALLGEYTFIVNVSESGVTYDSARFFTVNVR